MKTSIGSFTDEQYKDLLRYHTEKCKKVPLFSRNDYLQLQTILGTKKYLLADTPTAV